MGGMELTNIVIIILVMICIFALISACCRGLRHAYEDHASNEELARRRALFMRSQPTVAGAGRPRPGHTRAVRVTTISREGDTIAMGVYEIQVPRNFPRRAAPAAPALLPAPVKESPPPPFSTAYDVSSPVVTIDMEAPPPTYQEYLRIHNMEEEGKKDGDDQPQRY